MFSDSYPYSVRKANVRQRKYEITLVGMITVIDRLKIYLQGGLQICNAMCRCQYVFIVDDTTAASELRTAAYEYTKIKDQITNKKIGILDNFQCLPQLLPIREKLYVAKTKSCYYNVCSNYDVIIFEGKRIPILISFFFMDFEIILLIL